MQTHRKRRKFAQSDILMTRPTSQWQAMNLIQRIQTPFYSASQPDGATMLSLYCWNGWASE